MEDDIGTHDDGPHRVVGVRGDGLGQIGLHASVGSDGRQWVEDGAGVEDPGAVVGGGGGIEPLLIGFDPEDQFPTGLGSGGRDSVGVRTGTGGCFGAGPGATCLQKPTGGADGDDPRSGDSPTGQKRTSVDVLSHVFPLKPW